MSEFDSWAPYYDLLHPGLPGEAEFYVCEAVLLGKATLEVGCGTGRISIPMAMNGVKTVGIDLSRKMLSECRRRLNSVMPVSGSLELKQADMRRFDLNQKFGLIVMPYRTFMHCLTMRDQLDCLARIYNHLEYGGRFIFNLWLPKADQLSAIRSAKQGGRMRRQSWHRLPEGGKLVQYADVWRDDFLQLICERHRLVEKDSKGRVLCDQELTLTRAWICIREMEHLLERSKFSVKEMWGSFDKEPIGPDSTEMIWCVERKN